MKNQFYKNTTSDLRLNTHPFFSIIIATYNRAQLLKKALNSLIMQNEEDWEAIIMDDGSTDDTYSQIVPYLLSCPKIKYSRKAHNGEAITKNEGVYLSGGKFISFLDSDDEYSPGHLENRKSILIQNPLVKFLYGGVKIIGNQFVPDRFNHGEKISLNNCVIGGSFFIDRNFFLSLNGFNKIYLGTDADLFDRIKKTDVIMMETSLQTYIYHHELQDSITNKLCTNIPTFKV
jgi:glycosyltransferase involved in cell wall biosynthesis